MADVFCPICGKINWLPDGADSPCFFCGNPLSPWADSVHGVLYAPPPDVALPEVQDTPLPAPSAEQDDATGPEAQTLLTDEKLNRQIRTWNNQILVLSAAEMLLIAILEFQGTKDQAVSGRTHSSITYLFVIITALSWIALPLLSEILMPEQLRAMEKRNHKKVPNLMYKLLVPAIVLGLFLGKILAEFMLP